MTEPTASKIMAVVTTDMNTVAGGAPIFLGRDDDDCQRIARSLSHILDAMTHDLENGTYILVNH